MGNKESAATERQNSEARTRVLLEQQRKYYEEKCKGLLEQAQATQQANNVASMVTGHASAASIQHEANLYPNLFPTPGPSSFHTNNNPSPQFETTILNSRANASTFQGYSSVSHINNSATMVMPSAPPEPTQAIQLPRKEKGLKPNRNSVGIGKEYDCETCGSVLTQNVYQCPMGHSSCSNCKLAGKRCGVNGCGRIITDVRNRSVEVLMADLAFANVSERAPNAEQSAVGRERKVNCPNSRDGCRLNFIVKEIPDHLKECPFNEMKCPLNAVFGRCSWRGKLSELVSHFVDVHPEHNRANVDTELSLLDINNDNRILHLVAIGPFVFLINIKVDRNERNLYMAVQFCGTTFSASKWNYEFHIYNKSEPRRKFQYFDVCRSNSVPTVNLFNDNNCAVIPTTYAGTFENNGSIKYKFYIKKTAKN